MSQYFFTLSGILASWIFAQNWSLQRLIDDILLATSKRKVYEWAAVKLSQARFNFSFSLCLYVYFYLLLSCTATYIIYITMAYTVVDTCFSNSNFDANVKRNFLVAFEITTFIQIFFYARVFRLEISLI